MTSIMPKAYTPTAEDATLALQALARLDKGEGALELPLLVMMLLRAMATGEAIRILPQTTATKEGTLAALTAEAQEYYGAYNVP